MAKPREITGFIVAGDMSGPVRQQKAFEKNIISVRKRLPERADVIALTEREVPQAKGISLYRPITTRAFERKLMRAVRSHGKGGVFHFVQFGHGGKRALTSHEGWKHRCPYTREYLFEAIPNLKS